MAGPCMWVAALVGCSDRHASYMVSEAQAPEGGGCLPDPPQGCRNIVHRPTGIHVESRGGKKAVMVDRYPCLGVPNTSTE